MDARNLNNLDLSKLQEWSLGVLVEDIDLDNLTDTIKIYPLEKLPDEDINLMKDNEIKVDVTNGINLNPNNTKNTKTNETIVLKKKTYINAKWLSKGNYNRISPPTMRKEEFVMIYRMANADIFYWEPLLNDIRLRKEERVIYAYSVKDKINLSESLEDMYYIDIDTKNKKIKLHTTDKYGEFTTYDITLDTGNGYIEVIDGKGNYFKLNSDKDDVSIKTNNSYNLITDKTINETTTDKTTNSKNTTENIDNNSTMNVGNSLSINLKHLSINNGSDEMVSLLAELTQAIIDMQNIGNLGIPTVVHPSSVSVFTDIKSRIEGFE